MTEIGTGAAPAADRRPAGIEGFPGPYPVGRYAEGLRKRLRELARVCIIGEVTGLRMGRGPNVYFELRDSAGALPCAMWRTDFERLGLDPDALRDGVEVVAAGGCDYYVGGPTASPSFSFRVQDMRPAGEGDLLARLERLRRQLAGEGLFEPQKRLRLPLLPRTIGVVTAEGSAARRDFLAGIERRGWRGRLVWGYAPVQDRRAAPAIATAIRDLAALGHVDVIVVTRGGGSIADLWAFCDETLCRTVAMLPVPVVSAVGHDVDRTLIDDVAAVACSTPTHAAEAVVGIDCRRSRAELATAARRIALAGEAATLDRAGLLASARRVAAAGPAAVIARARALAAASRAPREHVGRHRRELEQQARELRAASSRGLSTRREFQRRVAASVLERKRDAAGAAVLSGGATLSSRASGLTRATRALAQRREQALTAHEAALRAHDPERTLERGYALALDADGEPLSTAAALREARQFDLRLADGQLPAEVRNDPEPTT